MSSVFLFPGQGSQKLGMGEGLFARFPELTASADKELGYSISQLCLENPGRRLGATEFTQPALFVVNALSYYARVEGGPKPDFMVGHSLGEYNALMAAGVFDFVTGLRLVRERGRLMAGASGGGMAAIIGLPAARVAEILHNFAFDEVDVANYNSPQQTVISGPAADVLHVQQILKEAGANVFPLNVSGAFHSRMMRTAEAEFRTLLEPVELKEPAIPVVANATAAFYELGSAKDTLARQITSPVRWTESIRFLLDRGPCDFHEIGPGQVLTKLVAQIRTASAAAIPAPAVA